jgi:Fe2+ transport system protein FeoA
MIAIEPPITRTLSTVASGARALVLRIDGDEHFARRLMDLGMTPGTEIALVRRAPFGDPIELVVRGSHFSIRRSEADRIHVEAL